MSNTWLQLIDEKHPPAWNMACDEWLLGNAARFAGPILRVYGWDRPSLSIGYFQTHAGRDPAKSLVRRPTGGGVVDHMRDVTYSVILPRDHPWCGQCACDRYRNVHGIVIELLGRDSLQVKFQVEAVGSDRRKDSDCFSTPTRYDLLLEGRKAAGAAQRLTRNGLLHQGSIQCDRDLSKFAAPTAWRYALEALGFEVQPLRLTRVQTAAIQALSEEKYAADWWTRKR